MSGEVRGLGLFSGSECSCAIEPARAGSGIAFVLSDGARIPATLDHLSRLPAHPAFAKVPPRHTCLAPAPDAPPAVLTIEHALGALAGLGVWDATLTLDGPEVPIGDGSAAPFLGWRSLPASTPVPAVVREPIRVASTDGSAWIEARPAAAGRPATYRYQLDFGGPAPIGPQSAEWIVGDIDSFVRDVAPARTFSLRAEAEALRALGLFSGFAPADLLVVGDDGEPIDNLWRFPDEPARHKLLDLIGDLALVGRPVHADVTAHRSGHALNHELARRIADLG